MSALSEAGFKAIEQRNWPEAIEKLTKAIDQSKSPAWLLARSQAFMETGHLDKAIADAEYAYCTAAERGNDKSRKQMIEAQYRRSVCFFRKKEYANADICAVWSQRLAKGVAVREAKSVQQEGVDDKGFYFATVEQAMAEEDGKKTAPGAAAATGDPMAKLSAVMGAGDAAGKPPYERDWNKAQIWRSQVLRFLEALPGDDPARRVTVQLTPAKPTLQAPDAQPAKTAAAQPTPAKPVSQGNGVQPAASDAVKPAQAPAPDYSTFRTQFYQSDTSMTVSVFMKFASKEEMGRVEVRFVQGGKFAVIKGVPRRPPVLFIEFHDRLSVDKSTHRVASMKLELTLVKEVPGKWPDFGTQGSSLPTALKGLQDPDLLTWIGTAGTPGEPSTNESATALAPDSPPKETPATVSTAPAKAPAYPTSSKTGPKDWDNILKDDDADDDENSGDVDAFFKKLYKDSTPEQQRAMLKSYTESNGTSLSTDWNQVSQGLDMGHKD